MTIQSRINEAYAVKYHDRVFGECVEITIPSIQHPAEPLRVTSVQYNLRWEDFDDLLLAMQRLKERRCAES